jgi:chromosome segregation ATPase
MNPTIAQRTDKTKSELSDANSEITTLETAVDQTETELVELDEQLTNIKDKATNLNQEKNELVTKLNRTQCYISVPSSKVKNASSNNSLIEPITTAVEDNYSFASIRTTFSALWNNSKTATFEVLDSDRAAVIVVASWDSDSGNLQAIYDVNSACYYYLE